MDPYSGLRPGICVEEYLLVNKLGQGSGGCVFEGHRNNHAVALKFFPRKKKRTYRREVATMQAFSNSPNVVRILDNFSWKEFSVIVMECCKTDLLEFVEHTAIRKNRLRKIFKQICEAVAELHSHNISHRDLKPENIFLDETNTIKLGDFGGAIDTSGRTMVDRTSAYGTCYFHAPEVIDRSQYDPIKADIWSLGIILHFIITKQLPYFENNEIQIDERCSQNKPLYRLLKSLLLKNPNYRPSIERVLRSSFFQKKQKKVKSTLYQEPQREWLKMASVENQVHNPPQVDQQTNPLQTNQQTRRKKKIARFFSPGVSHPIGCNAPVSVFVNYEMEQ